MFWCFVLCTPHQNTRVHYCYCCWKVFHSSAAIFFALLSFHVVCVCIFFLLFFAFFIIIIRCYRTFSLAHTHPSWKKWRDDFSFSLFYFIFTLLLSFVSWLLCTNTHTFTIVHNWLYFTRNDIFRSSVLYIHVEYWAFEHILSIERNTCLKIQFTFFSFRRFLDIYFHLSSNEHSAVIEQRFKRFKNFDIFFC